MSTSKKPRKVRSDGAGHLDPKYAADLLALGHHDKDESPRIMRSADSLAEQLGEAAVRAMNSGEDEAQDTFSGVIAEERGGPFVITKASKQLALGTDESNPEDATREPFPKS